MPHIPVLLKEVIEYLNPKIGDTIVDGTINGGGHSEKILEKIGEKGKIIGLDQDNNILKNLKEKWAKKENIFLVNDNFRNLDKVLDSLKIKKVSGVLFDIGISSLQLEESGRGFSFQKDEPLLMTMKASINQNDLTAENILNNWTEEELNKLIWEYGEERFSRRIAKNIIKRRERKQIKTTMELVDIVREVVPFEYRNNSRINCATKTFQALRIAVNDELEALKEGLSAAEKRLVKKGRLAVISFHSLEDRIVKKFFKDMANAGNGKILTKKPIIPSENEIKNNPRSRSAKLRVMEKIINN